MFDPMSDLVGKFAGRHLGRIDLLHPDLAGVDVDLQRHPQSRCPREHRTQPLIERKHADPFAARRRGHRIG